MNCILMSMRHNGRTLSSICNCDLQKDGYRKGIKKKKIQRGQSDSLRESHVSQVNLFEMQEFLE